MSAYSQSDLTAKKVADLKTILTDLKLSAQGVKADLISRILEHQRETASGSEAKTDLPAAGNVLGSIPSEDKLPSKQADGASAPSATGDNNVTASTSATATAVGNGDAASTTMPAPASEGKADAPALPEKTDKLSEAERRKARLQRFGNTEELAKLDRAEKFGSAGTESVSDKAVSTLDSELSNKRQRLNANGEAKVTSKPQPANGKTQPANGKAQAVVKASGDKPVSKGKPNSKAAPAKKTADPEEEERRRKRAERFAGGQ